MHLSDGSSFVNLASPIFAAIAAGASWASVALSRRAQRDLDQPQLVFRIESNTQSTAAEYPMALVVENVGRGPAIFPGFTIWPGGSTGVGTSRVIGQTLGHGDEVRYGLPFTTSDDAMGIVFCEDRSNGVHAWSASRGYKHYRKSKRRHLTPRVILDDLYDGRGHEFDMANTVGTISLQNDPG